MTTFKKLTPPQPTDHETDSLPRFNPDAAFPFDSLPPVMRDMVLATAKQNGIAAEIPAMTAMGVMSAATGAGIILNSGPGKKLAPNLFLLLAARSGTGKSVSFSELADAMNSENHAIIEDWQRQQEASETDIPFPSFIVSNATGEAVARALSVNPGNAAAVVSPDGRGAIGIIEGKYTNSGGMDLDVYLNGWARDPIIYARKTGPSFAMKLPSLSVFLAVQPDKLTAFSLKPEFAESGLAARFLMARIDSQIDDEGEPVPAETADRWADAVVAALGLRKRAADAPVVSLSPDAEIIRKEIVSEQKRTVREGCTPAMETTVNRWAEQSMRLALVFHVTRHGRGAGEREVSGEDLRAGETVATWFIGQAKQILAAAASDALERDRQRVLQVFTRNNVKVMTARMLRLNHSIFPDTIRRVAAGYPEQFRFRENVGTGGRPTTVLELIG
jgi:hypothetical protein